MSSVAIQWFDPHKQHNLVTLQVFPLPSETDFTIPITPLTTQLSIPERVATNLLQALGCMYVSASLE